MQVVIPSPIADFHVVNTKQLHYYTPRAALMEQLEKNNTAVVGWTAEMSVFKISDVEKLIKTWAHRTMKGHRFITSIFWFDLFGSVNEVEGTRITRPYRDLPLANVKKFKLVTLSTERRKYVNDLVVGKVYEWIIKFLIEDTRRDWLRWIDKQGLEFQILNLDELAKTYTVINGLNQSAASATVKLFLSSYCMTKILIKVDEKKHVYKFNKDWYNREINKPAKEGIEWHYSTETMARLSRGTFPSLTL